MNVDFSSRPHEHHVILEYVKTSSNFEYSEETKAKNIKYMNTWIKENYMRVGGSYPKAFAQEFKDACKQLGVSQSEVFRNAMQETINKVK